MRKTWLVALLGSGVLAIACAPTHYGVASDTGDAASSSDGSGGSSSASSSTTGAASDSQGSDGGSSGGDETTGDPATTGSSDATGEELYALCAPCHGPAGEGSELGYELRHPSRPYATWVVRNGRPGTEFDNSVMAPYSESILSDADLEKIWDYLDSFEQPTTSEGLYLDYCGNCHGPDATGGVVGVIITDKTFPDAIEKVREGEGGTNYGNRPVYMPGFDTSRLTDDEVQLIVDFWLGG
jgi:mono/diheme cytochrome c family protein